MKDDGKLFTVHFMGMEMVCNFFQEVVSVFIRQEYPSVILFK